MTGKRPCPQHLAQHPTRLDRHASHRLQTLCNRQCARSATLVQPTPGTKALKQVIVTVNSNSLRQFK